MSSNYEMQWIMRMLYLHKVAAKCRGDFYRITHIWRARYEAAFLAERYLKRTARGGDRGEFNDRAPLSPRGTYQLGAWWPGNHCHGHLVNKPGAGGGMQGRIATWRCHQLSTHLKHFCMGGFYQCEVFFEAPLSFLYLYFKHHFQRREFHLSRGTDIMYWSMSQPFTLCWGPLGTASVMPLTWAYQPAQLWVRIIGCRSLNRKGAHISSLEFYNVMWRNCCFHPCETSADQDGDLKHSLSQDFRSK